MITNSQQLLQNIRQIRKITQRSIHDCASFLDISKNEYLAFERGENFLSLPQIELLAAFLGVPVSKLFEEDPDKKDLVLIRDRHLHPRYQHIRQKMVRAEISLRQAEQNLSLEDLHQITQIPVNTLEDYLHIGAPIPIHHMLELLQALNLAIDLFLETNWQNGQEEKQSIEQTKWQPEFPDENQQEPFEEDLYILLRDALKALPKTDQAKFLKALLTLLRTER